jgi:hypothetical protein
MYDEFRLILFEEDGVFGLEGDKVLDFLPGDHLSMMVIFLKRLLGVSKCDDYFK